MQGPWQRRLSVCLPQEQRASSARKGCRQQGFLTSPPALQASPPRRPTLPLWPTACTTPHSVASSAGGTHSPGAVPARPALLLTPSRGLGCWANLGYPAVLQTLLQLQLIIHSGCQRPGRQKGESNNRDQDDGRGAPRALTQQPSDSHGGIKEDPVTHVRRNPPQTPQHMRHTLQPLTDTSPPSMNP